MEMIEVGDGLRLRTWTTGVSSELPPVVLLHGGPGMWDYLEPVAEMLAGRTVVHRFDQRGCGGSDRSAEQSVARTLNDLEVLRRHWHHESWLVAGHSFGAELALAYATAHPGRTVAMAYLNGVGVGDWRTGYRSEQSRRMTAEQQARLAELEAGPRTADEEIEFRALSWFTDFADPVQGWEFALADARTPMPINFAANRILANELHSRPVEQVLAEAAQLTMPCLLVHGRADPRPLTAVARLAGAIPHSVLRTIEGAGHEPWRERPEAVRELLDGFLTNCSGPPAARSTTGS